MILIFFPPSNGGWYKYILQSVLLRLHFLALLAAAAMALDVAAAAADLAAEKTEVADGPDAAAAAAGFAVALGEAPSVAALDWDTAAAPAGCCAAFCGLGFADGCWGLAGGCLAGEGAAGLGGTAAGSAFFVGVDEAGAAVLGFSWPLTILSQSG